MKNLFLMMVGADGGGSHELAAYCTSQGHKLVRFSDDRNAFQLFREHNPHLIFLTPSRQQFLNCLNLTKQIRCQNRNIPIIIVTAHSSEDMVIAALKAGVSDYFKSPLPYQDIIESIRHLISDTFSRTPALKDIQHESILIGQSPAIRTIRDDASRLASVDSTVLITGETGTGKEVVAELIHRQSSRYGNPFICINCSAIPESLIESELFGYAKGAFTGAVATKQGYFEAAKGGSLFLDEIGDMSVYAQAKILRAIEKREIYRLGENKAIPINVRLIAATHRNLNDLVSEGKFRKDLYYRLNVAQIHIPPLRERKEDIPLLTEHFISELNHRLNRNVSGFAEDTMRLLFHYDWHGNVRELKNIVEACFINLSPSETVIADIPSPLKLQLNSSCSSPAKERKNIVSALTETQWNKSKAAKKLNCSRMTLYRKMEKYRITEERMCAM